MIKMRLARQEDCAMIAFIYNQYLGKSTMDLDQNSADYYQNILKNQDDMEELWVIEKGEIIGWGIIKKYSNRKGYRLTGETSIYLHPDHLAKGYGSTLKKHLLSRCRNLGYHHLVARIFSENEVSINYNIRMGYTVVGVQKEAGFVDGKWKDVTILQYVFK